MKFGIRLSLAELSLINISSILDIYGVDGYQSTVHNLVPKADLQTLDEADSDHVAVNETVIQLDTERYLLYAAVDVDTNHLLHVWLFPARTQALTEMFLSVLCEKHRVDDLLFLVDTALWLQASCHRHGLRFQHEPLGIGPASNVSAVRYNVEPTSSHTVPATPKK